MLSAETCLQIISKDVDLAEEVLENLATMDDEEAICYLHESIELVAPTPKPKHYEIGYPSKFNYFYENFPCLGIIRHGAFYRNTLLNDEILFSELCGEDGATGQKYKGTINMQDSASVKALKDNLSSMLVSNPVWKNHILRIIDEIRIEFPFCEIDISIFNPGTGVFTIYYALTKEQGYLFLPSYSILIKNPGVTRMYYGALEAAEEALTLPEILQKYYGGSLSSLLATTTWCAREYRDGDIIESLGLQYRSYLANIVEDAAVDCYTLRDEKWRPCKIVSLFDLFDSYVKRNSLLINQILSKIVPHDKGSLFVSSLSDEVLEKYVDLVAARKRQSYYMNAPDTCDICQYSLSDRKFMVDGEVRGTGAWANMCADCFVTFGTEIGPGSGQLYQKDPDGWLLVGGFYPDAK